MSKNVSIRLLNDKRIWHPGDTVTGEVLLVASEQADVQDISITLKGKAKSRYRRSNGNSSTTYRSKVTIFRLYTVLFRGPFTLPPGQKSWPFEFIIPINCQYSVGDKFQTDDLFESSDLQPLPPSFSSGATSKDCQIEYALEARMESSKTFSTKRDCLLPLWIIPLRINQPEDYRPVIMPYSHGFHTLHLDPEIGNRDLSFKEKMRTAFKSDTLPTLSFLIKTELPQAAAVGEPVAPLLHIEHNPSKSTATEIPPVYLTSFSITLKSDIWIKPGGHFGGNHVQNWTDATPIGSWAGRVPITDTLEIAKLFPRGLGIRTNVGITFKTYNVAVLYRWKVKYHLECATKKMSAEHTAGVVILGADSASLPRTLEGQPQIQAQAPIEEEQLPAYIQSEEAPPPATYTEKKAKA